MLRVQTIPTASVTAAATAERLITWSGLYPARLAVSEDDGQTWSALREAGEWGGIVVMGFVVLIIAVAFFLPLVNIITHLSELE